MHDLSSGETATMREPAPDSAHRRECRTPARQALAVSPGAHSRTSDMVPLAGLEPARCCHHLILSQARLPIPPQGPSAQILSETRTLFGIMRPDHTGAGGRGSTIVEGRRAGVNRHRVNAALRNPHAGSVRQSQPCAGVLARRSGRGCGADHRGGRRRDDRGRVVLRTRHQAQSVPALPRAALALLHRNSACARGGARGVARRAARARDRRPAGARRADAVGRLARRVSRRHRMEMVVGSAGVLRRAAARRRRAIC